MAKVLVIISQQRAKAQATSTDATNNPLTGNLVSTHIATPTARGATGTQPATAAANTSLIVTATPTHTLRYPSWAELCKPSGRLHPTFEDVFISVN